MPLLTVLHDNTRFLLRVMDSRSISTIDLLGAITSLRNNVEWVSLILNSPITIRRNMEKPYIAS